jgi:hypothetical protein
VNELIRWLASHPTFVLGTALWGIIGTVASLYSIYITYHFNRQNKKMPCYMVRSTPIFYDTLATLPELSIRVTGYGKPITNLTVTNFLFWNEGAVTIQKTDVPADDSLGIKAVGDCRILRAEVVTQVNPAAHAEVSLNIRERSLVAVSFEFMDCKQPFLVKVAHTGKSSSDLTVIGQVIGAGPFIPIPHEKFASLKARRYNRITTSARRSAALFNKVTVRKRWVYGMALTGLSMFIIAFSAYKIQRVFKALPSDDAFGVTFFEFVIYFPFAYYFGLMGYFVLNRVPPQLFDDFEGQMSL